MSSCKDYGCPKPEWKFDGTGLWTTLWFKFNAAEIEEPTDNPHGANKRNVILDKLILEVSKLLLAIEADNNKATWDVPVLMDNLGSTSRRLFTRKYIEPALRSGLIERTIPDKPTSRNQQYRLTDKGRQLLSGVLKSE